MHISTDLFHNTTHKNQGIDIDKVPDTCPLCEKGVELKIIAGTVNMNKVNDEDSVQIVLRCPRVECRRYSIAYYARTKQDALGNISAASYRSVLPKAISNKEFEANIATISPDFVAIYNQALTAESGGLDKIAGVGYRKSLEFLIKDYLISKRPDDETDIKKKFLGACITEYVADENVKAVSARAVWLGNDETHYTRIWEEKDINDLKGLIDLTVFWINSEALTEKLKSDMPDGGPAKAEAEAQNTK